jgi:hypothetical protein
MTDKNKTFHVYNCPQRLIDRINAKAALKGKGSSEWVVEVLERETKKLKPLQDEYIAEDDI